MRLRDHYDWIVLGDHPAALLSAGLAARQGNSVLVLPLGEERMIRSTDAGMMVDLESNYVLGLGRGPAGPGILLELLHRLG